MKKSIIQLIIISGIFFLCPLDVRAATIDASRGTDGDTCVAPCSIIFKDGDGIIDSAVAGEIKPFHDYNYVWSFGDPASGEWETSKKSKNTASGPVSAHIYETPGEYTVNLGVYDPMNKNQIGTDQIVVTVTDPDDVFIGDKTTCISDASRDSFIGCPEGANQIVTDDLTKIGVYAEAGERLLFLRGSSWILAANINWVNNSGPVYIGAYGDGDKPHLTFVGGSDKFINLSYKSNWRVMDLHISGPGTSYTGIEGKTAINHVLVMNNEIDGWNHGISISHWRTDDSEANKVRNLFLAENTIAPERTISAYVGAENLAIIGNDMQGGGQHTLRVFQSYLGVISHNILSGAGHDGVSATGYGGHTLKFHGPDETIIGSFAETGNRGFEHRTKYTIIANNVFGGAGDYQVAVAPQSTTLEHDERLTDIIVNNNRFLADYGLQNETVVTGLSAGGSYFSITNNVFNAAGQTGGYRGVRLVGNNSNITTGHLVSDNVVYRGDMLNIPYDEFGVEVSYKISDSIVRDNYVSFPNSTGNKMAVSNGSDTTILINNILTDDPIFLDPDNPDPLLRDFSLIKNNDNSKADVDNSGTVNTSDALLTLRKSLGLDMSTTSWQDSASTGDANCDGNTNSTDALLILRFSLGLDMGGVGWCG